MSALNLNLRHMSFKEASAWVMLAALSLASLSYILAAKSFFVQTHAIIPPVIPFIIFTIIVIAVSIVGHIVAALSNLSTVNEPTDEWDRVTLRFASHWSGIVLGVCVVMGLLIFLVIPNGAILFHIVFAGLILSHITDYVLQIIAYGRMRAVSADFADED